MHELLHTLGMMHELMRPDRDKFVILHTQNVESIYLSEFKKVENHTALIENKNFDFQSITLYDPFVSVLFSFERLYLIVFIIQ